jgi:hypothetical protein
MLKERVYDGIERCRRHFELCYFDRVGCSDLLMALSDYREDYDKVRGIYTGKAHQGPETDYADVFRYAIQSVEDDRVDLSGGNHAVKLLERHVVGV